MPTRPQAASSDGPPPSRTREILRLAFIPAALLIAAALAACGDKGVGTPTDPAGSGAASDAATTAQISADVASEAGDASASLTDTYGASETASGASASRAPAAGGGLSFSSATACAGPDAAGFFSCTKTEENGLTITRAYRYWSAGKVALRYAEASTDSVNHRWTLAGNRVSTDTAEGETRTVKANRADTSTMQVVRGATSQHVWNGVGVRNDTSTVTDKTGTRSYAVTASDTAKGVAYAQPRKGNPWPLAGTVIQNVRTVWTSAKGTTTTTTRRAVVTFNGTQTASIQAGALTCALDLKTHRTSGCK